jgi:hypothetical protein
MRKRHHRGTPAPEESTGATRTTAVHVLSDDEELRRALRRAAEFDQRTADMLLNRSAHYRALLAEPVPPASPAE